MRFLSLPNFRFVPFERDWIPFGCIEQIQAPAPLLPLESIYMHFDHFVLCDRGMAASHGRRIQLACSSRRVLDIVLGFVMFCVTVALSRKQPYISGTVRLKSGRVPSN